MKYWRLGIEVCWSNSDSTTFTGVAIECKFPRSWWSLNVLFKEICICFVSGDVDATIPFRTYNYDDYKSWNVLFKFFNYMQFNMYSINQLINHKIQLKQLSVAFLLIIYLKIWCYCYSVIFDTAKTFTIKYLLFMCKLTTVWLEHTQRTLINMT